MRASDPAAVASLDRLVWMSIGLVGVVVLAAPFFSTFKIDWLTFQWPALAGFAIAMGIWFYRRRREDPKIASALTGTGQILAFAAVAAPLSYLAASSNLPLVDSLFDACDRAMGFDWRGLLGWMNANPSLHWFFKLSYASFTIQATTTVLALAFTANHLQIRRFVLAFILTTIITIAISALLPAQGVWGHYGLTLADHPAIVPSTRELHLQIFNGLRDGSFRTLTATGSEGIITFPSLHAAIGVIFILALWPVAVLRWISLAVNLLMIAATPIDGGHYFIDVIAGTINALIVWAAITAFIQHTAARRETPQVARIIAGE